jgi:glutaredoxin 3
MLALTARQAIGMNCRVKLGNDGSVLGDGLALDGLPAQLFCMTRIILYTTPFCGYCTAAKRLLRGKELDFEEVDVSFDADRRAEMSERAQGLRTVPQIFIHGRHVGGYDELAELEREGKLDAWLANAPEATAPEALAEAGET